MLKRGFTLIEALVTITILTILFSAIILSQRGYTDRLVLNNIVDELAALLTQAQTYGSGTKELGQGSGDFSSPYGINFNVKDNPTSYIFFVDKNKNGLYDGLYAGPHNGSCSNDASGECLEVVQLPEGFSIYSLCWGTTTYTNEEYMRCYPFNTTHVWHMSIIFKRPSHEPSLDPVIAGHGTARVFVRSSEDKVMSVVVYPTGLILTDYDPDLCPSSVSNPPTTYEDCVF